MGIRSFRINFRSRGAIDPNLWNQFWNNLSYDINDIAGSGVEPMIETDLGIEDFLDKHYIAVSGMAGKEE
jgi:hypothetical protein